MTTTHKQVRRRRTHYLEGVLLILLLVLVVLLLLKGSLDLAASMAPSANSNKAVAPRGPFVQPHLTTGQVDELQHMVSHMPYKMLASLYVSRMSLDEELGQLIMVQYYDSTYSADLEKTIVQMHAGGVILYQWQMHTFEQTHDDTRTMQQHANIPLFISTDEEGGYVDRIGNIYPRRPGATEIFYTGDVNVARTEGRHTAHDLQALGINTDMAPDVDVPIINGPDQMTRTFGDTANDVVSFAGSYLASMQKTGMIACLKHYPGLGAATIDAHEGLPVINRSKDEIYSVELAPYKAFINAQNKLLRPGMILATDLLMPAIDPNLPAEISPIFINDILRKQLGYDGVVITDALYMQGIADRWTVPQAAVLALKAGDDMIIGPNGSGEMGETLAAIKQALRDGTLTKARVDEAASRILALKMEYHLIPASPPLL